MNKIITTDNGGIPMNLNHLRWFLGQDSYNDAGIYQAIEGFLKSFGDNFIVQGCTVTGGVNVAAGWIILDGELLKVDAHTKTSNGYYVKVTTYNTYGNMTAQDGSGVQLYQKNRATATGAAPVSGSLLYTESPLQLQPSGLIEYTYATTEITITKKGHIGFLTLGASATVDTITSSKVSDGDVVEFYAVSDGVEFLSSGNITMPLGWGSIYIVAQESIKFVYDSEANEYVPIGMFREKWQIPSLAANWSNVGGGTFDTKYKLDSKGKLYIRGTIQNSVLSGAFSSESIFQLPSEHRPLSDIVFPIIGYHGGTLTLASLAITASTGWVSISHENYTTNTDIYIGSLIIPL